MGVSCGMFSYRLPQSQRSWFARRAAVVASGALVVAGVLAGCGTVGPTQRTQEAGGKPFAGVECEPGLVIECEPACSTGDAEACEIAGLGYLAGKAITQDLERARIMLERACDKDRPLACSGWAKMARDGQGVNLSTQRQTDLLTRGCDAGDANACYRLGSELLSANEAGSTTPTQLQRAHDYFDRACNGKDMNGCLQIGIEAKTGRIGAKDLVKAVTLLGQACDEDLATGCFELADLQVRPGTAVHNPIHGRQNFAEACTLGLGIACSRLAQLMETGEKNIARARELHERACQLEQWDSCTAVGNYQVGTAPSDAERSFGRACSAGITQACLEQAKLLDGRTPGFEPAPERALPLYERACTSQIHPACGYAAHIELQKLNGKLPAPEARQKLSGLVRMACEAENHDESCLTWARWLALGEAGLTKDGKRAADLLGPLCARAVESAERKTDDDPTPVEYGEACHRLGVLHETGAGVDRNALGAASLYDKGCTAGYAPSCLARATQLWHGTGGKKDPELAVGQFKRLCTSTDAQSPEVTAHACIQLGYAQQTGLGAPRDTKQAKAYFEQYCAAGHQLACAHLGRYLVTTKGSETDRKQGETLLRSSCDAANGHGCLFLADLPQVTKSQRKELLSRACQLDTPEACAFKKVTSP